MEIKHVRFTDECLQLIDELKGKYPEDYKSTSDVVRAGIFALTRWKYGVQKTGRKV